MSLVRLVYRSSETRRFLVAVLRCLGSARDTKAEAAAALEAKAVAHKQHKVGGFQELNER